MSDRTARRIVVAGRGAPRSPPVQRRGTLRGGFQNRQLTELALSLLQQQGFTVYLPEDLPTNDAAIGFGQIIEAGAACSLGRAAGRDDQWL